MIIFKKISDFFKNLQGKPEETRRRWLWIFIAVPMAILVCFWLLFSVSNIRANLSPTPSVEATPQQNTVNNFWSVFQSGLKSTFSSIVKFLRPFAEASARFFVTIFSGALKAGQWLIQELAKFGSLIKQQFNGEF